MKTFKLSGWDVVLVTEPLQAIRADVLVSSDDNYLSHGGGVSAALWRAAGEALEQHVKAHRPTLRLGDLFQTPGFKLPAKHLLHAVTIDFDENQRLGPAGAVELYRRVLEHAARLGGSVALPLLGSGAGRVGTDGSCRALCKALVTARIPPGGLAVTLSVLEAKAAEVEAVLGNESSTARSLPTTLPRSTEVDVVQLVASLEDLVGRHVQFQFGRADPAKREAALAEGPLTVRSEAGSQVLDGLERLSLSAKVRLAEKLGGLPEEVLRSLEMAGQARNALMHGRAGRDGAEHAQVLLQALETCAAFVGIPAAAETIGAIAAPPAPVVLDNAVGKALGLGGGLPWALGGMVGGILGTTLLSRARQKASQAPTPALPATPPKEGPAPESAPQDHALTACPYAFTEGTQSVRELCAFLAGPLVDPAVRKHLLRLATDRGHLGADEHKLLELCVEEPELDAFLERQLSERELYDIAEQQGTPTTYEGSSRTTLLSSAELVRGLLDRMGFPSLQQHRGLHSAHRRLEELKKRAALRGDVEDLRGICIAAAGELEFLLQSYLRFLCQAVYREPPEVRFRNQKGLEDSRAFSKLPLGRYVSLAQQVFKELDALSRAGGVDPCTMRLADLAKPPAELDGLLLRTPELRNTFGHDRDPLELDEARRVLDRFFDAASGWLKLLGEKVRLTGGVEAPRYPRIIRIERVSLDRWGRRTSEAVDDAGHRERIFSEEVLKPGELYFMHPLTNPVRCDPILIPAGDTRAREE